MSGVYTPRPTNAEIAAKADKLSTAVEDNLISFDNEGNLKDSNLSQADTADAISKKHTQNTDTMLDSGGANEVTAAQAKAAYMHSQITTGNPHNLDASDVGADPAGSSAAVQNNLTVHENNTTNAHGIDNKADKVSTAVENNLIVFDNNGNLKDSGISQADTSDAISKRHVQNTDTMLDSGGANEVSAAQAKSAYTLTNVTPGTLTASKALVADANKKIDEIYTDRATLKNATAAASGITQDTTAIKAVDDGSDVRLYATINDGGNEVTEQILTSDASKWPKEYGIELDTSTGIFTRRLGGFAMYEPSAPLPEAAIPDWMRPRQFVINDAGVEQYELYKYDRRLRTTINSSGYRQDADLTGGDGHVVTRFQKHYVKRVQIDSTTVQYWWSDKPLEGYTVHPAFNVGGVEKKYIYVGAYDAIWYDVSTGAYVDGDGTNSGFDVNADKLGSVSGKKPLTNLTRAQFRAAAQRVDTSCQLVDIYVLGMIQGLYLLKYADFDSQKMISAGNTQFDKWNFGNCIAATGKSDAYGVVDTGQSTKNGNINDFVNLFGLEDIFGNLWQFIDGINFNSGNTYLSANPADFADDTATNYTKTAENTLTLNYQWQKTLINELGVFLPKTGGATSDTFITDYWYYASGWRIFLMGGDLRRGATAGIFFGSAYDASSIIHSTIGGRLCWKK